MKIFSSELDDELDLEENQYTVDSIIQDFYKMYDEKGAFWGIIDNYGKIIQFYWLQSNVWLVDIPNPPSFINYQKKADYNECVEIIKNILKVKRVTIIKGMIQVDTLN